MNIKPNTYQKLVHRFLMLKPVSTFLAVVLHRADKLLLKLSGGKYTVTRIVGLPTLQLTTKGAKTSRFRTIPLVGLPDGRKLVLIASNFGQKHHPGWYYNLKANPECVVRFNGGTQSYMARESTGEERERYFRLGISYYAGYEKYEVRAAPRHIPVMVLEPVR